MTELFVESILRKSINLKNLASELAVVIFNIEPKCEIDLVSNGCQRTYFIHKCNHNHLQNLSKNAYINIIYKTNDFALGPIDSQHLDCQYFSYFLSTKNNLHM